mmetsp:Transcript_46759/g.84426  ORF Transcript_46759/g.84426 Transcript_46759/m.84426 type:complete len:122 (-) Transcript_46759:103-468(-)
MRSIAKTWLLALASLFLLCMTLLAGCDDTSGKAYDFAMTNNYDPTMETVGNGNHTQSKFEVTGHSLWASHKPMSFAALALVTLISMASIFIVSKSHHRWYTRARESQDDALLEGSLPQAVD